MTNLKNNSEIKCSEIRDFLIRKNFDKMKTDIIKLIEKHLETCSGCRQYHNSIKQVQNSVEITSQDPLIPDPGIRAAIIRKMAQPKADKQKLFLVLFQHIWEILDFRIPVYQGIIGFAIIFLIFLGLNNPQFWNNQNSPESLEYIPVEQLQQVNVLNSLKFIQEQKVGKTVKEDTLLTHLLYTVM
ncbi:hypothetical protein H8E88_21255 [candidate division KSB1 bacterium]|nr:hypothetical protein [candidate division KSB1 bacterium]MBL7093748.1 hypothetical protein [candidate division KSB1 bacterium]